MQCTSLYSTSGLSYYTGVVVLFDDSTKLAFLLFPRNSPFQSASKCQHPAFSAALQVQLIQGHGSGARDSKGRRVQYYPPPGLTCHHQHRQSTRDLAPRCEALGGRNYNWKMIDLSWPGDDSAHLLSYYQRQAMSGGNLVNAASVQATAIAEGASADDCGGWDPCINVTAARDQQ